MPRPVPRPFPHHHVGDRLKADLLLLRELGLPNLVTPQDDVEHPLHIPQ